MHEYKLDEISVGQREYFSKEITLEMEDMFRKITGDDNPLHYDDKFAIEIGKGKFKEHAVFGMLTASLYSTFAGMYLPGKYSLIHSFEELSFLTPVFAGDILTVEGVVIDKNAALRMIRVKLLIKNQDGKAVSRAKMKILVLK